LESRAVFERNLELLRRSDPELAAALASADPGGTEVVEGPRGARSVACDGVLLGSAYDPEGEGQRMAEEMARQPADLVVAIGFGLGYHLAAYRERNACPVLVYEPSLGRLRAALSAASPKSLLGSEDVRFATRLDQLLDLVCEHYATGLCLQVHPHPSLLRLAPEEVREAVGRVAQAKRAVDVNTVTRVQQMGPWAARTMQNADHLLTTPSFSRLFGAFRGVPAVIAAAGPSLDQQLPLLARSAGRLLVFAIGQSLRALRKAGIEPDLCHAIESIDVSRQILDSGDPRSLSLVLLPSVHPRLFEIPARERFVAYPSPNTLACWVAEVLGDRAFYPGGATVAQSAVHLAAAAGANPILLIGQDLAFTGGRVYARDSAYDFMGIRQTGPDRYVLTQCDEKYRLLGSDGRERETQELELVWVEGWDGKPVPTSVAYASFIEGYRLIGEALAASGVRLLNCTEGGARIRGLEHRSLAEALAELPDRPVAAREVVRRAHEEGLRAPTPSFAAPLRRARRGLDRAERDGRLGLARIARALRALRSPTSRGRKLQALRQLAHCERRVRRDLEDISFLDVFVQGAIHRSLALVRRSGTETPEPEQALQESRVLFEGVVAGIDQARELLDGFERRIAARSEASEPAEGGALEVPAAPPAPAGGEG
jgi:hypothetical protein